MRFVVLGTSDFAVAAARGILASGNEVVAFFSLTRGLLPNNSADIESAANELGIRYFAVEDINSKSSIELLRSCAPDYLFVSWPKILGAEVLAIPQYFVIGSHPTAIPQNRGRHPLHWVIVLGLHQTTLSFFRMDAGIDTGTILQTVPIDIGPDDDVLSLNQLVSDAGERGMKQLAINLNVEPALKGVPQDHTRANYWRARTPHDSVIDLRMSAESIRRLVKSFLFPYPCARLVFEQYSCPIVNVELTSGGPISERSLCLEPGRIVSVTARAIRVKCGDGVIECSALREFPEQIQNARHIYPPSYYFQRWGSSIDLLSLPQPVESRDKQ